MRSGGELDVLQTPDAAGISGASAGTSEADGGAPEATPEGGAHGTSALSMSGMASGDDGSQAMSSEDEAWAVRPEDATGSGANAMTEGGGGGAAGASTGGGQQSVGSGGSDGSGVGEADGGLKGATTPAAGAAPNASTAKRGGGDVEGGLAAEVEQRDAARGVTDGAGHRDDRREATPRGRDAQGGPAEDDRQPDEFANVEDAESGTGDKKRPDAESIDPSEALRAFREAASRGRPSAEDRGREATPPWHRAVRGTWQLVSRPFPGRDFIASGSDDRIIGIDPDGRAMEVVLRWDGAAGVSVAGRYEVGFRPEVVEVDLPSEGAAIADARPLGLGPQHAFNPAAASLPSEVAWFRVGDELHLGGCVYRPVDPEALTAALDQPESHAPVEVIRMQRDGDDESRTVDFFGLQAEGRYICYVIDVSGSMGPSGGLVRLQVELEQSLASLPAGTQFAVLPFNQELRRLQPSWTRASAGTVRRVGARLAAVGAGGGTDPSEAFEWAFRSLDPRPDVIFFMTDGQLNDPDRVAGRLDVLNAGRPRTRIHAIGLGSEVDAAFLGQVADRHGGNLKLVR